MVSTETLSSTQRSFILVGMYLQNWAFMESQLNSTVGKSLGLAILQEAIVCANLALRDKINIARTAANMEFGEGSDTAKSYIKLLTQIANASTERNMIAHDMFGADKRGNKFVVTWFTVRANDKLKLPKISWSQKDFDDRFDTLQKWTAELGNLQKEITRLKLAKALTAPIGRPRSGLGLLGLGFPPSPPLSSWSHVG